jgi:hypothetical protein
MKLPYIIIIYFIFQCQLLLSVDNSLKPNFTILDSLSGEATAGLCKYFKENRFDTINISLNNAPAAWLIMQHLLSDSVCKGLVFIQNDSNKKNYKINVNIHIIESGISYKIMSSDSDSLFRNAKITIKADYLSEKNEIKAIPAIEKSCSDKIDRKDIPFIESREHNFANSPVPEPETTFFEDIAEPVIVITTAIITVVLLFTVRSN